MQLADLNSKPHGVKSLRNIIDCAIGSRFYPSPGSVHYKLICLDHFHGPSHINNNQNKNNDTKLARIKYCTPKTRANIQCYKMYHRQTRQSDVKLLHFLHIVHLYRYE